MAIPAYPQILLDRTIRLTWEPELPEPGEEFAPGTVPLIAALESLPPRLRVEAAYIAVHPVWTAMLSEYENIQKIGIFTARMRDRIGLTPSQFENLTRDVLLQLWGPAAVIGIVNGLIEANKTNVLESQRIGSSAGPYKAGAYRALTEALVATDRVADEQLWGSDLTWTFYSVMCMGRAAWDANAFGLGTATLPPIFYDWLDSAVFDVDSPAYWAAEAVVSALSTGIDLGFWHLEDVSATRVPETEFVLNDWWSRVRDELSQGHAHVKTIHGKKTRL